MSKETENEQQIVTVDVRENVRGQLASQLQNAQTELAKLDARRTEVLAVIQNARAGIDLLDTLGAQGVKFLVDQPQPKEDDAE